MLGDIHVADDLDAADQGWQYLLVKAAQFLQIAIDTEIEVGAVLERADMDIGCLARNGIGNHALQQPHEGRCVCLLFVVGVDVDMERLIGDHRHLIERALLPMLLPSFVVAVLCKDQALAMGRPSCERCE